MLGSKHTITPKIENQLRLHRRLKMLHKIQHQNTLRTPGSKNIQTKA